MTLQNVKHTIAIRLDHIDGSKAMSVDVAASGISRQFGRMFGEQLVE
ncbi:MAG: hypothetical protein ABJZ55_06395 [Fuerstiella sp.]